MKYKFASPSEQRYIFPCIKRSPFLTLHIHIYMCVHTSLTYSKGNIRSVTKEQKVMFELSVVAIEIHPLVSNSDFRYSKS